MPTAAGVDAELSCESLEAGPVPGGQSEAAGGVRAYQEAVFSRALFVFLEYLYSWGLKKERKQPSPRRGAATPPRARRLRGKASQPRRRRGPGAGPGGRGPAWPGAAASGRQARGSGPVGGTLGAAAAGMGGGGRVCGTEGHCLSVRGMAVRRPGP